MGMIINPYLVQPSGDADAQAFITAAGITDSTQKSAIETLVTDLKGYGIWTKMKAIYPFVGGTATTHKYNLKDPQDTDAAFRLVFSGGWTHSSTGALPNGTNAYADTKLAPSSQLNITNHHLSYYSRTQDTSGSQIEIGAEDNAGSSLLALDLYFGSLGIKAFVTAGYPSYTVTSTNNDTTGLTIGSRTSNISAKLFQDNTLLSTFTTNNSPSSLPTRSLYLAYNNHASMTNQYSVKECAFASIGEGLSDTEASNFYTAVQSFQTTLSRNV